MNNNYYETLDKNFINALNLCETNHTHEQLISMLKNGNIPQRQIAALKLEKITSQDDAQALLSNLTGQDGKIREAVSLRLKEFMSDPDLIMYFDGAANYKTFLNAAIDINANICRNVICAILNLKNNDDFCKIFCSKLSEMTKNLLTVVEKFNFQEGKYKVNKEAFKLYWCLETIYVFYDKMDFSDLKEIIIRAKSIQEYTIREKVAKILSKNFEDKELQRIRTELKNDPNYYVRRY